MAPSSTASLTPASRFGVAVVGRLDQEDLAIRADGSDGLDVEALLSGPAGRVVGRERRRAACLTHDLEAAVRLCARGQAVVRIEGREVGLEVRVVVRVDDAHDLAPAAGRRVPVGTCQLGGGKAAGRPRSWCGVHCVGVCTWSAPRDHDAAHGETAAMAFRRLVAKRNALGVVSALRRPGDRLPRPRHRTSDLRSCSWRCDQASGRQRRQHEQAKNKRLGCLRLPRRSPRDRALSVPRNTCRMDRTHHLASLANQTPIDFRRLSLIDQTTLTRLERCARGGQLVYVSVAQCAPITSSCMGRNPGSPG